ncbi:dipeptidase [Propionibacterium freudenreichii]|uniref:dipeptidase n=1 Tax=Propionibacterium freudenreichii TaxID=1744 RepID=UPI00254A8FE8|nr:dipeptidase [Propionibacterium freudenreichii]MDK9320217.1 dipeptidase [Propionibacterium freudenreichii]
MASGRDQEVIDQVREVLPGVLDDLRSMVRIPSVSSQAAHAGDITAMADQLVGYLKMLGWDDVRIIEAGGKPAVLAHYPAPEGKPTVCLYSHYDVQPTGDLDAWTSDPFVAVERDGRLYGRGTADDKGGLGVHLAALRAFKGKPPVGVTVLFEGEEEIGSPSLDALLDKYTDELEADAYLICDCGNWEVGTPAFTTSLRGVVDCVVQVSTLDHAIHSGEYGGVAPDALTALCRLMATLHDERGNVAVEGLVSGHAPEQLEYPDARMRAETGVLDGVEFIGDDSFVDRMWNKPSISVIGLDTTPIAVSSNVLIPSASARVSLRVAPGDTAENAREKLFAHLRSHAPWGARVTLSNAEAGEPASLPFEGPIAEEARAAFATAWGTEPVLNGTGGSIGMTASFQRAFPQATILGTAVSDPHSRMHGIDESLHLGDWRKAAASEALLLDRLAR